MCEQVVIVKVGWCVVMCMVKDNGVECCLYCRELVYFFVDDLCFMSDKVLGVLCLVVVDNEYLCDVLCMSEDLKCLECKIQFFVVVYQYLCECICQDIICIDDLVEVIEQMEIEFSCLIEELIFCEQKLAISFCSVVNIICKIIQCEQNCICMFNQGLQNVLFGQVNSVCFNVNVCEMYVMLLDVFFEQYEQYQDLFNSNCLIFLEVLVKLY